MIPTRRWGHREKTMRSRTIRLDAEVKAALDILRLPDERNYDGAILRLLEEDVREATVSNQESKP